MRARKIDSVIRVLKRCGEGKCVEAAAAVATADVVLTVFVVHHIAATPLPSACQSTAYLVTMTLEQQV